MTVTMVLAYTSKGPWVHDPGRVFTDLAVAVAGGADCVSGIGNLVDQQVQHLLTCSVSPEGPRPPAATRPPAGRRSRRPTVHQLVAPLSQTPGAANPLTSRCRDMAHLGRDALAGPGGRENFAHRCCVGVRPAIRSGSGNQCHRHRNTRDGARPRCQAKVLLGQWDYWAVSPWQSVNRFVG